MNFFGVGLPEMLVIFTVALLVFGPRKLPEIGRTLAKTLRSLQDASKEFETQLNKEARELEKATRTATTAAAPPKVATTAAKAQPKTESVATADTPAGPLAEMEPTPEPEPVAAATPEADHPQTADAA
ncbi:TatA/E family twin arginine-targeting protein translocase [Synechococcus sp. Nb3U1]|uniref:TatA/E family twin arginine-targeting protein translocase n=1 Tax=Synechococcus sp. Nb3U1 TaxID=1914529 RepID=UPI001F1D9277|nr:TatA/E family twin arginine-targeting protein translocase [Synechococcus sp. Nb3U1]MCF2972128.1 TatA/E family twin arginine-targeting protein translocase [Synechococcus sp. Nb3U1]